jgi:anti-sigma B factor antagonist
MKLSLCSEDPLLCRLQTEGDIRLSDQPRDAKIIESLLGTECYARKILLDLQRTPYIDSSGVAWLLNFHKHCREAGGVLVLHSVPPAVMAILKLLHVDRHLNLVEDEQAARVMALGASR